MPVTTLEDPSYSSNSSRSADARAGAPSGRLIEQFTGGDEGIHFSLQDMYREQGVETALRGMIDPELMEYVGRALRELREMP